MKALGGPAHGKEFNKPYSPNWGEMKYSYWDDKTWKLYKEDSGNINVSFKTATYTVGTVWVDGVAEKYWLYEGG